MDSDGNDVLDNYDHNLAMSKSTTGSTSTFYHLKAEGQYAQSVGDVQGVYAATFAIVSMGEGWRITDEWLVAVSSGSAAYLSEPCFGMVLAGGSACMVGKAVAGVGSGMMIGGGLTVLACAGLVPESWGISGVGAGLGACYALAGVVPYVIGTVAAGWGEDVFWMGLTGVDRPTMPERMRDDWKDDDVWGMLGELI